MVWQCCCDLRVDHMTLAFGHMTGTWPVQPIRWLLRFPHFPRGPGYFLSLSIWTLTRQDLHQSILSQQTFYIGPILDSISARHRLPTLAADIGPTLNVQLGYTSGWYRLPTCSQYCADIQRSSLFLAKTLFSWLLKPSANKIGKGKTGECINFNKFIHTNFKATFLAIWRRRCTCLYSGRNRLKTARLQRGWLLGRRNIIIILTWGCYAAFEDIGTSSSDDVYSCAGSLDFFYISFDHLQKCEQN